METPNRREFIKTTAATAAALASGRLHPQPAAQTLTAPSADPLVLELANEALNAARSGGASYADVRVGRYRRQIIQTRERQVTAVADDESYGIGIRTLVDGCWGFAATSTMTRAGVQNAAREALTLSRAAKTVQRRPVELAASAPATRHVDDAGAARSDRGAARREDCAAPSRERSRAQGQERPLRQLGLAAASRGEDAGHVRGHERHADVHSRWSLLQRHGDRDRRLPDLRRRARAARPGMGIRRVARHAAATPSDGRRSPPRNSRRRASRPGNTI